MTWSAIVAGSPRAPASLCPATPPYAAAWTRCWAALRLSPAEIGSPLAPAIIPLSNFGGKGPLLVFEDCDLEAAARKAAGQFDDAGQVCLAGTRILVQQSVAERFMELFHRFADQHVLGDPRSDDTTVTPLIHREHFDRVAGFVERARANGDEIVRFLYGLNRCWSLNHMRVMWREHLAMTKEEAVAILSGDYAKSVTIFDRVERQALKMADEFSEGILGQFCL